uniref:Uncharacterized protein n=1 Tax=Hyaloperonospora arabidopsidis (strain Emoy2) TaxID=559515 RepID=M4C0H8_HYAAE
MQAKCSISPQASLRMCSHFNRGFSRRIARNAHQRIHRSHFLKFKLKYTSAGFMDR